jgi:Fatty acid desaturase
VLAPRCRPVGDAGHNQVFSTRRRNRLLGLIAGDALIGLSFGWWVPKHNAHHAHPNEIGRDPDIGEGTAPPPGAPGGRGPLVSWLARWQAPLFFPLMLLRSSGMHVLGISRLARRRDRAAAAEACILALHAALYLTVVLWVLSPLRALAFAAVQQAVFSLYLLLPLPGHLLRAQPQGHAAYRLSGRGRLRPPPGDHGPQHHRRPAHYLPARRPELPGRASPVPLHAASQPAASPAPGEGFLHVSRLEL